MLKAATLWELLQQRVAATPDAAAVIDDQGQTLSYADYHRAAEQTAAGLAGLGVGPDSRVSWQLPTRASTLVLMAALFRLGAVQNPIIPIYRAREVGFCVRQTQARLLVVPSIWRDFDYQAMATDIAAGTDGLQVLVCDDQLPAGDPATLANIAPPAAGDAVRWVFYTSGTTSDPKGAMHSDRSVMASGVAMVERQQFGPEDRFGAAFPFAHVGGVTDLAAAFSAGCALVITEAFDPPTTTAFYARHGVTVVGGGPAFWLAFLGEQRKQPGQSILPELRFFSGGGAPMPANQHHEVRAEIGGRGCCHAWGMTEAPIIAQGSPDDPDEKLANTEGRPLAGAEVRAVAFDGTPAATGEEGELWIRGPMVCHGYLDSALNAEVFVDGWFRTGDVGFVDADGYVTLTGRRKDIIIRKGENISAAEIEDLLYAHPKVADVGVIGLPDPERGERVCAVVAPADAAHPPTLAELADHCRAAGIMPQKIPEQLEVLDDLPRNATGKILKHELRARFT